MRFIPAVYEHAARLIDRRPWEVSRDEDLLVAAHTAAFETYRHEPVTVGIDIYNLEAEAYGALVAEPADGGVPSIKRPPFERVADILDRPLLDPGCDARLPMILDAGSRLAADLPTARIAVPVSGPFSLAAHLVGAQELLSAVEREPDTVDRVLAHLATGQTAIIAACAWRGLAVTVFESVAAPPRVPAAVFHDLVLPSLLRLVGESRRLTGHAALIIGGDTAPVLDDLLATGADFLICPAETDQAAFLRGLVPHPAVEVRCNLDHDLFTHDDPTAAVAAADAAWPLIADRPGAVLGTGVLPWEARPQTVSAVARRVAELAARG